MDQANVHGQSLKILVLAHEIEFLSAVRVLACCNLQFLHQWLRWIPHGLDQQLPPVPILFPL